MFENPEIMRMAHLLASHSAARQAVIAANVANADTPGYLARDIAPFGEIYRPSETGALRATRPGHIGAVTRENYTEDHVRAGPDSPNGNSVTVETEMIRAAEVRHAYDMALAVYTSAKTILRTSLGR